MEQYKAAYPGYTVWIITDSSTYWFTVDKIPYSFPSPKDGIRIPITKWSLVAFKAPSNNNVKEVAVLIHVVPKSVSTVLEEVQQPTGSLIEEPVT